MYPSSEGLQTCFLAPALPTSRSVVLCKPFGFPGFHFLVINLQMELLGTSALKKGLLEKTYIIWGTMSTVEVPFC